ncbi:MAG: hypothetical protein AAF968_19835 [Pseudomonadota bacterium]
MLDITSAERIEPAAPKVPSLTGHIDPARLKRLKDQEYRTMYWLIMPVCLVIACAARLFPRWDAFHSTHRVKRAGIIAEASHMAHTVIPFAFWR